MSPSVVGRNAPASAAALMVKSALVMVGAVGAAPLVGMDTSKYQGSTELVLPNAHIPKVSPAMKIVSPLAPVAVLQAAAVAGGGQKPTFAKAEIEAARNTSSSVSLRVTLFLLISSMSKMSRRTQMLVSATLIGLYCLWYTLTNPGQ